MAEEFLDFLDSTNWSHSFDEFEEMWSKMGEELEKESKPVATQCLAIASTDRTIPATVNSLDENRQPLTSMSSYMNAEDSVLTTLRRNNAKKMKALDERLVKPVKDPESELKTQFKLLRTLEKRVLADVQQMDTIMNHIEHVCSNKKRVKFSTV